MPISNIQIKQVTDQKLIKKWMKKFLKAYYGNLNCLDNKRLMRNVLDPKICRFIFAFRDNTPVGFVRLSRYSELGDLGMPCLQDAYVRTIDRSQGILRMLIQESLKKYNVGYINLSKDRIKKLGFYYSSLGFEYLIPHPTTNTLGYLATQELVDLVTNDSPLAA